MSIQLLIGVAIVSTMTILEKDEYGDLALHRDIGNRLQAAGVTDQAIISYEKFLDNPRIAGTERSKMAFTLGTLNEENGAYEKALGWYYQVAVADPTSQYKNDADKRIVALLERLKKFSAAKYALKTSTSLAGETKSGGVIVAKIDSKPIYLDQLNQALDKLPPQLKKQFGSKEGKKQYLQKYIADELMVLKAHKLQYHKEKGIIKQLEDIEKQLLVQRIIKEEISDKIKVDLKDLENYFTANKERYTPKGKGKKKNKNVKFEDVQEQVINDYKMEKMQSLYQQVVTDILKIEKVELFPEKVK